jgi:hypothetical protein
LGEGGGGYTWSNNHDHPTLEKFDRIMMTKEWELLFPTAQVYKIPRAMSDHNPLVWSSQCSPIVHNREFRFELAWLKDPDFIKNV